jgi:DNA polymerase II small subunit
MKSREKLIEECFNRGILINQGILEKGLDQSLISKLESEADILVLNEDYVEVITKQTNLVDWYQVDEYRVVSEREGASELYQMRLQECIYPENVRDARKKEIKDEIKIDNELKIDNEIKIDRKVEIEESSNFDTSKDILLSGDKKFLTSDNSNISSLEMEANLSASFSPSFISPNRSLTVIYSYKDEPQKYSISSFSNIFMSRYNFLEKILRGRRELQNAISIGRLLGKKERENVSIIGLVEEIAETKNGNLMITLEDPSGRIKVLFSKSKKEIYQQAKDLVHDEVVGISGANGDKILFGEEIVWPDIPLNNELKKSPEEEYALFLSDFHVGSKFFLEEEFQKFLRWINGQSGSDQQKEIASKVKYIFGAGDLVDGIGVYPSQLGELNIGSLEKQYQQFANLIKKIPLDKQLIFCPGNHDGVQIAEPQPIFYERYAEELFKLPNVILVSNPGMVNIGKTGNFGGFDVLLYHGYSFDYYIANVESIRMGGGYHRADLIMQFLLRRRHLAPAFKSTPYYPSANEDNLLIKKIPDFLITGHIHYSNVANYRGVTMISGSCWQSKTGFQEKMGHEPEPARVPIVNLKTRQVKVLRFG